MPERDEANPRIERLIVDRWSPRSFDASEIPQDDLDVIFEAAGWAPSAFNLQPWTFLYARRGDADWDRFLSLLVEFNAIWVKNASVLVFIVSDTMSRRGDSVRPSYSHSFDCGAAWALMALQATALGYHAHGMVGIDFERAISELGLPEDHRLEAAVAIGRQAPREKLPPDLQAREVRSGRKPLSEIVKAGNFR